MKSIQKIATVMAIAVILSSFGCASSSQGGLSQEASAKLAQSSILKKGWKELPVPIYISQSIPENFRQPIIDALETWNDVAGIELFSYAGDIDSGAKAKDRVNVIYWDNNENPDGYFGETFFSWVGADMLIDADVVFYGNPDNFAVLPCESESGICKSNVWKKDITTTALHELGHALGFEHSDELNNIMNPYFHPGDCHRNIDEELIAELTDIYSPNLLADNGK